MKSLDQVKEDFRRFLHESSLEPTMDRAIDALERLVEIDHPYVVRLQATLQVAVMMIDQARTEMAEVTLFADLFYKEMQAQPQVVRNAMVEYGTRHKRARNQTVFGVRRVAPRLWSGLWVHDSKTVAVLCSTREMVEHPPVSWWIEDDFRRFDYLAYVKEGEKP